MSDRSATSFEQLFSDRLQEIASAVRREETRATWTPSITAVQYLYSIDTSGYVAGDGVWGGWNLITGLWLDPGAWTIHTQLTQSSESTTANDSMSLWWYLFAGGWDAETGAYTGTNWTWGNLTTQDASAYQSSNYPLMVAFESTEPIYVAYYAAATFTDASRATWGMKNMIFTCFPA